MLDQRPYLLRALNEWIVDSGCTPHVLVDATRAGVEVPDSAVSDGRVVLNISPTAVRYLHLGEESLTFEARFGGVARQVSVPLGAVLAIYARENGAGMAFEPEDPQTGAPPGDERDDDPPPPAGPSGGRPGLRIVK
ncbi:MAG: ClpXP protease specificity-enhancing factor [Pseudomonadales bacterium]|jgi:stringent starvation protein B|nr:ClpXP protease specificity-enhancing factor [Pseudomonadales bacterium]